MKRRLRAWLRRWLEPEPEPAPTRVEFCYCGEPAEWVLSHSHNADDPDAGPDGGTLSRQFLCAAHLPYPMSPDRVLDRL